VLQVVASMGRKTRLQSRAKYCIVCAMRFAHDILQESRVFAGLKRSELAALAGITPQALRNIETGRSEPRPPTALALASALDIDVSDLWTVGERAA
jgi:DNA-binding XRE family transcriptional regulator